MRVLKMDQEISFIINSIHTEGGITSFTDIVSYCQHHARNNKKKMHCSYLNNVQLYSILIELYPNDLF